VWKLDEGENGKFYRVGIGKIKREGEHHDSSELMLVGKEKRHAWYVPLHPWRRGDGDKIEMLVSCRARRDLGPGGGYEMGLY
jgi:hypothetical protein